MGAFELIQNLGFMPVADPLWVTPARVWCTLSGNLNAACVFCAAEDDMYQITMIRTGEKSWMSKTYPWRCQADPDFCDQLTTDIRDALDRFDQSS